MPYVTGKQKGSPHARLFWKKLEGAAVRDGHWKLIKTAGLPAMLYNLKDDLNEYHNLARKRPDKVRELLKLYEVWNAELEAPRWGEGEQHVEKRRNDYIRFRDSRRPLQLSPPKKKKSKK